MLVALEGPDRAGKTTIWNQLRRTIDAKFIPSFPHTPETMRCVTEIDRHALLFWEAMYDPGRLYVCDRHVAVSSQVYAILYGREVLNVDYWYDKVCVLYVRQEPETLVSRMQGERIAKVKDVERTVQLYDGIVAMFSRNCIVADEEQARAAICDWRAGR